MSSGRSLPRKVLISLLVVGLTAALAGGETMASFNAETTNSSNVFATGTLYLNDATSSQTTCLSSSGSGNVNAACNAVFNVSAQKPGSSGTYTVTITNDGSVNAGDFQLTSYQDASHIGCSSSNVSGAVYSGTGNLCSDANELTFYLEETSGGTNRCVYPASNCTTTPGTLAGFASLYGSQAGPGASGVYGFSALTGFSGPLDAGESRVFQIGLSLSASASNSYQGIQAVMPLTWHIDQ
ncbi:MAG TPA: SipW-dependent-type signal peptide-containing protein [Acidimicrobiales bacterium]|nr:SipW-dependent-type signal peptide-containing protein [Acidimicrobiales bacterium]